MHTNSTFAGEGHNVSEGTIQRISEITGQDVRPMAPLEGKGGQLGIGGMIRALAGTDSMDGYEVVTDQHAYRILISNEQSCCENFGYLTSEDDLTAFIGAELREVRLTDTALNQARVDAADLYLDQGGIQFVDFVTDKGTFQLAVYNGHNGYYGHGILVTKDDSVLLNETL